MCAAPCTLFCPRSGFTPAPGHADVAGEQREVGEAHHGLGALHVLGHARGRGRTSPAAPSRSAARPARIALGVDAAHAPPRARAASRRRPARSSSSPVDARRRRTRDRSALRRGRRARSRGAAGDWCRRAVGGGRRRSPRARCAADRRRSAWRPARAAWRIRAPTIGWLSVALAPTTRIVARALDVVERAGRGAGAEHRGQRGRARRVADARAAVDVVGAEHDARELLREVVVLVGRARRAEHADRVGAGAARIAASRSATCAIASCHDDVAPAVAVAEHRRGDPVAARRRSRTRSGPSRTGGPC